MSPRVRAAERPIAAAMIHQDPGSALARRVEVNVANAAIATTMSRTQMNRSAPKIRSIT